MLKNGRIVTDDEKGRTGFLGNFPEQFNGLLSPGGIEVSGRFVGQNDIWFFDNGPSQSHPLLLAHRKLGGTVVETVGQTNPFQHGSSQGLSS
jgi:hypothetical protein